MQASDHQWVTYLARAGYSARGIIYLIIGFFAILATQGAGEKKDTEGELSTILIQPFGTFLVWTLIIGLIGYVLWRLIQSLLDTDDHGWSPKGLAVRIGLLISAFTYASLALYSLSITGVFSQGGDSTGSLARMLDGYISRGNISLFLSVIFAGAAIAHWWKAVTRKYVGHFQVDRKLMPFIHPIAMMGLFARGCVFLVIAFLLFYRYLNAAPEGVNTPGLKDAMHFLQQLPQGQALLFLLGVGLIFFALYSLVEAWFRRINLEDASY